MNTRVLQTLCRRQTDSDVHRTSMTHLHYKYNVCLWPSESELQMYLSLHTYTQKHTRTHARPSVIRIRCKQRQHQFYKMRIAMYYKIYKTHTIPFELFKYFVITNMIFKFIF